VIISGTGAVMGTTVTGTRLWRTTSCDTPPNPTAFINAPRAAPKPRVPQTTWSAPRAPRIAAAAIVSRFFPFATTITFWMRSGGRWQPNSETAWCSHTRSPSEEDDSCESAAAMMIFVGTKEKSSARQSSALLVTPRARLFPRKPKVGESDVFT
jgi:hypothetical protein